MKHKNTVSKVMLVVMPVIMVVLLSTTVFGVTAWISPDTSKYNPCDTFWVSVEVDTVTGMAVRGVGIVVACDSSELEMLDADMIGCLPAKWGNFHYDISDGKDTIRIATAGSDSLIGAGCLVKLQFHMKEYHGPGYLSTINLNQVKLNETNVATTNGYCLVPLVNVWVDTLDARICKTTKVPVYITDSLIEGYDVDSIYIELTFDTTYIELVEDTVSKGDLFVSCPYAGTGWYDTFDLRGDSLHIWMWDTTAQGQCPVGTGAICTVYFHVDTSMCHCYFINLNLEHAIFRGIDPSAILHDGALHVLEVAQIFGDIYYHANTAFKVPGCTVTAYGQDPFPCPPFAPDTVSDVTDSNGQYVIGDMAHTLRRGDYLVCPHKPDYASNTVITAWDAALILMWWVNPTLHPLTQGQQLAGDVSGVGGLSPYDAGLILLWWVNYPTGTFPAGAWRFIPECTLFVDLRVDPEKDFEAVPMGDVSNNWVPPPAKSIMPVRASEGVPRLISLYGTLGEQGTKAVLSLNIDDATDILSAGITLSYDASVLKPLGVSTANLTSECLIADNITNNEIRIALAGGKPLSGGGSLASIEFQVIKTVGENAISAISISGVQVNDGRIKTKTSSQVSTRSVPKVFELSQNYPNPVSGVTDIGYQLPVTCDVDLSIYNLAGRLVRTLVSGEKEAGDYTVHWNGKDELGNQVASGVYFYRIKAGHFKQTKRMVVLR